MAKLANMARMTVSAAPGTSTTIGLSSNVTGYLTFAQAGLNNGDIVSYAIDDSGNREVGIATYSTSGPSLTGRTVVNSTNSNALITASSAAQVFLITTAADSVQKDGCCQFNYTSTTVCTLIPFGGNTLIIGNILAVIPSAGVTLSATGLSASTLYYIYAWLNAGVVTLEASTTAYAVDANTGRVIKNGDSSRRLVGMVYVSSGTQFFNVTSAASTSSPCNVGVRTWFNDPGVGIRGFLGYNNNYAASAWAPLITAAILNWGGEIAEIQAGAQGICTTSGGTYYRACAVNGSIGANYAQTYTNAAYMGHHVSDVLAVSEGYNSFAQYVYGDGSNAVTSQTQCYLLTRIRPVQRS